MARLWRGRRVAESVPPGSKTPVFWEAERDRGQPRLLFIARPDPATRQQLEAALAAHGIDAMLGRSRFDPDNWHQSVSERYLDTPQLRRQLMAAGASLAGAAITLPLDRVLSTRNLRGRFNWEVRTAPDARDLLLGLVNDIKQALGAQGLPVVTQVNRPHITLSYGADSGLPRDLPITPVYWPIAAVELVSGGGAPYRYTTLARWPLSAEVHRIHQAGLF